MLQSSQPPPFEALLTTLLNEIAALPDLLILVLDDYHLIESPPVDGALAFLLEHLPPQLHLVIATREDPRLPLARLRARDQLTELRAADLRFTPAEAAVFLNRVMDLDLSPADVAALETRTEGWIAGLQLAALSMQGHRDTTAFIRSFTGSHHFVLDYLLEEVLHRQPESRQTFLLRTSILDRLCAPLCDAVVRDPAIPGQETLEQLQRANLFIVPLDSERRWYRYHHLFADLLQQRLHQSAASPAGDERIEVTALHRRASGWHEEHGYEAGAFHHAVAAGDFERAADLAELAWPGMERSLQSAAWLGWVKALPADLVRSRPVLSVGYAWASLDVGELELVESRLQDAEGWLDRGVERGKQPEAPPDEFIVVDEEQFCTLPASIAAARAYRALALGDVPGTVKHAQRVLDLLPGVEHQWRGAAAALLGLAQYASGDLEAADRSLTAFMVEMREADQVTESISITFTLAEIKLALGRLHEAIRVYQESLQLAVAQGELLPVGTSDLHRGLSDLYRERGDLEAAAEHLQIGEVLGEEAALTGWHYRLRLSQSRLKEARGELEGALELLDEAERLYIRSPLPDTYTPAALRTRVWLRQGRLAEAQSWVRERGLAVDDNLSYVHEFEQITLVRVLLAGYRQERSAETHRKAVSLLKRLLQAAEAGGRWGSAIEILILQALAHQAQGDLPLALAPLERALELAAPEGYVQVFVNEGMPMAQLLAEAAARGIVPHYTSKNLALLTDLVPTSIPSPKAQGQKLVEPLSDRELEVLELVAQGLTNREIGERLYISPHTVKVHTYNIYGKLGAHNRTEASAKARALGILPAT
jgi:LuxR family maltose regulon positive regulatory protein